MLYEKHLARAAVTSWIRGMDGRGLLDLQCRIQVRAFELTHIEVIVETPFLKQLPVGTPLDGRPDVAVGERAAPNSDPPVWPFAAAIVLLTPQGRPFSQRLARELLTAFFILSKTARLFEADNESYQSHADQFFAILQRSSAK